MKVMHERVAGIDVHKKMIKVAIRSPGDKPWTRKTAIGTFRTFYGVLREMARELRARGVTHVVMEASGVYTEPVYYALLEEDFTEVLVVNPAHVKALKGHKTDAKDCARVAELLECGLLQGSYIPAMELKEVRDLTRYRTKTVQARTSEIQRLDKALESAGIKLGSVASDITGKGPTAMIEALIDGERRGAVMVLAATVFAHESAAFGVDVLAGAGGDVRRGCRAGVGSGCAEQAGERGDGFEQQGVSAGLLVGGAAGAELGDGAAVPGVGGELADPGGHGGVLEGGRAAGCGAASRG